MKKYTLNRYEQKIEDSIDDYIAVSKEEKKRIMTTALKSKTISIRLNEDVLNKIKVRAVEEGLSYQTLISSILHKYSTDRLVDRKMLHTIVSSLKK